MAAREGVSGRSEPRVYGHKGEAEPGTKAISHLGKNISCVGSGRGQGSEERGLAGRLDGVDHPQLWVLQVAGLAVGVDEHKDIVHTYGREPQASRGGLRITLLSPESDPRWACTNPEWPPKRSGSQTVLLLSLEFGKTHLTLQPPRPRIQVPPSMLPQNQGPYSQSSPPFHPSCHATEATHRCPLSRRQPPH